MTQAKVFRRSSAVVATNRTGRADQNRRSAGQRATGLFAISAEENAGSPPLFATSVLV
jgi:hypothetical protein